MIEEGIVEDGPVVISVTIGELDKAIEDYDKEKYKSIRSYWRRQKINERKEEVRGT